MLRNIGERLARKWSQPVIVENRPGGSGFIATGVFRQASPDGHDLIQLDSNHTTTHPHTYSKLPYNVERDFTPISMLLRTPFFVAVAADSPFKTVDDIIAAARPRPDAVTYGSWFNGSPGHIGTLRLLAQKGVQMVHVPFRDFGALYQAVANKEVDWALASAASGGAMERAGRIRFLVLAAPKRDPLYPNVPTTAEIPSLRGFEVDAWAGLFGPKAMPLAVRDQIAADVAAALTLPEVVEQYRVLGYEIPTLTPAAFEETIRRETLQWGETIRAANLKLD
ncbi:Tricarboxylate transport protein TctC [plant metagenome]|uniref:Tricarboxylate transport protein TctC n=1 Tax=plant metagenome TaxID=1297885 RepID=A0A484Q6G3_9ZZZZ